MGGLSASSKIGGSFTALKDTTESRIRLGGSTPRAVCTCEPYLIGASGKGRCDDSTSLRRRRSFSLSVSTRRRVQGILNYSIAGNTYRFMIGRYRLYNYLSPKLLSMIVRIVKGGRSTHRKMIKRVTELLRGSSEARELRQKGSLRDLSRSQCLVESQPPFTEREILVHTMEIGS